MSNPNRLLILAKDSPLIDKHLRAWEQGQIDWEGCLCRILDSQIKVIRNYQQEYKLEGKLINLNDLIPHWDGAGGALEKQAEYIQYIELAHHIQKSLVQYAIAYEQGRPFELVITGEREWPVRYLESLKDSRSMNNMG